MGNKSTGILISLYFEPNNNRKPLAKGGINISKELKNEYGDMVVGSIYVTGEN